MNSYWLETIINRYLLDVSYFFELSSLILVNMDETGSEPNNKPLLACNEFNRANCRKRPMVLLVYQCMMEKNVCSQRAYLVRFRHYEKPSLPAGKYKQVITKLWYIFRYKLSILWWPFTFSHGFFSLSTKALTFCYRTYSYIDHRQIYDFRDCKRWQSLTKLVCSSVTPVLTA